MSLAASLNIALSGIKTTSLQLEQTASNISNAASEGYTAKVVTTESANLGAIGGGVLISGFKRSENTALFTTLSKSTSNASYRSSQDNYLQQVMDILGTSSSDNPAISSVITDFISAWNTLAATPESLVNQRQVISEAQSLCEEVQRLAEEVEALDRQCKAEIESTVSDLNSYLSQIRDLNGKISQAQNAQQSSGDLEDARDQLILKVSGITEVNVMERPNGAVAIYTTSGYQLLDSSTARSFTYDGTHVYSTTNSSLTLDSALGGGKLQALVDFRMPGSSTVTAANITTSVTAINTDLSDIQTLNAQIVAEQALGNDTSALEANRATLVADLSNYVAVTTTANADGSIDIETDDGYALLTSSAMAVLSFDGTYIVDTAAPSVAINGSLTGGSLEIQLSSYNGSAMVSFDQATSVIQKLRDQLDEIVRAFTETVTTASSGEASFAAAYNNATTAAGNLASGFFTGTSRTNFSVNSALINGTATLKSNASAAVSDSLLDATRSFAAAGLDVSGSSYATFVTSFLTGFQQAASNISTLNDTASSSHDYLEEKYTNQTAVNTDSELIKLVEYQNAYSASAQVMSVIQELFQVLQNVI